MHDEIAAFLAIAAPESFSTTCLLTEGVGMNPEDITHVHRNAAARILRTHGWTSVAKWNSETRSVKRVWVKPKRRFKIPERVKRRAGV